MPWHPVAAVADLPDGGAIEVIAGEHVVAVYHIGGEFFALDGVCPHQGGPLAQGEVRGCIVTCPWHGWQFDVRDGQHQLSRALKHPTFRTKVEAGQVWVEVAEAT